MQPHDGVSRILIKNFSSFRSRFNALCIGTCFVSNPFIVPNSNDCRFEKVKKKEGGKNAAFFKKSKQSKTLLPDRNGKMLASVFYHRIPRSLSIDPPIIGFASNPEIFQRSRRQICRKRYESCRVIPKSRIVSPLRNYRKRG